MSDEESPTTTARGDESDLTLSTTTTTATGGLPPAPEESILLDPPSRTSAPVLTSESLSLPTATATPATGIIREGREGELVTRTLEDDASTGSGSYHSLLPQDQQEEDAYQQIQNDGLGVRESIEEELSLEGMDPFYVPSARARSISLDQHPPLRAVDEELDLLQLHETMCAWYRLSVCRWLLERTSTRAIAWYRLSVCRWLLERTSTRAIAVESVSYLSVSY